MTMHNKNMHSKKKPGRKNLLTAVTSLALLPASMAMAQDINPHAEDLANQWQLLDQYCVDCHNIEDWAGSIAFDTLGPDTVGEESEVWEAALRKMRGRLMPPPGNDKPPQEALDSFIASMENTLDAIAETEGSNPGHIAVHRLNRKEYANAIRDILALDVDASSLLPTDTVSDGFDNVANVLQVSPSFLEQYLSAARQISIKAVGEAAPEPDLISFEPPSISTQYRHVAGLPMGTRGGYTIEHYFPADGEYEFDVTIASQEGSLHRSYPTWWVESEHRFIMTVDGVEVFTETLGGHEDAEAIDRIQNPAIVEIENRFKNIRIPVSAGTHTIGVAFVARSFAESDRIVDTLSPGEGMDNIPLAKGIKLLGPFNPAGLPDVPSRQKIFSCYPESAAEERPCAEQIMSTLAREAFRRPVTDEDMAPIMDFYENGHAQDGFETGIQKAIMAMLSSTKFLYRAEPIPVDAEPGQPFPVTDLELATRLSFFLWSSVPDDELLALAEQGTLRDPAVMKTQINRMLADPRAKSLTDNFAWQWLRIGDVDAIDPDPRLFPEFDDDLRMSMKKELTLFVDSILRNEESSVLDLLSADHTYIDERLARHYEIDSVRGTQFREVKLEDDRRWGLLGKSGLLMLTSYPNRTSPVIRGSYILETLIGTPPAAPPPGVETDLEAPEGAEVTTIRARLEQHREQPSCNQCHGVIDPLGLALENFNAIGKWRDKDRYASADIDALGQLASGQPVAGPDDLRNALLEEPDQFVQAITEKLMTYALGRTVEHFDMPIVRSIVREAEEDNYSFESILLGIVESDAFQMKSLPSGEEGHMALND